MTASSSSFSRQLFSLIMILLLAVGVSLGLVGYVVYKTNQKSPYRIEQVLIHPSLFSSFYLKQKHPNSGEERVYRLSHLKWYAANTEEKQWQSKELSEKDYQKLYHLLKEDSLFTESSSQEFSKPPFQLLFTFQSQKDSFLSQIEVYEHVYRVELLQTPLGQEKYLTFKHPNIQRKLLKLL